MAKKCRAAGKLNDRQRRFVEFVAQGKTYREAYRRAGYSGTDASVDANSSLTMARPHVAAYLAKIRARLADKAEVTAERVIREYARIAFSDLGRIMEWGPDGVKLKPSTDLSEDDRRAVAEVSEIVTKNGGSMSGKLHDKVAALNALGKHLGMFVDKTADAVRDLAEEIRRGRERVNGGDK